jgi:hypothetical protein
MRSQQAVLFEPFGGLVNQSEFVADVVQAVYASDQIKFLVRLPASERRPFEAKKAEFCMNRIEHGNQINAYQIYLPCESARQANLRCLNKRAACPATEVKPCNGLMCCKSVLKEIERIESQLS